MEAPYDGLLIEHIFFIYLQDLGKKSFEERKVCTKRNCFAVPPISVATIYVASAARFSLPLD